MIHVVHFINGKGEQDKIVSASNDPVYSTVARTYLGMELLLQKKIDEAKKQLQWVVDNGNNKCDEYYLAKALVSLDSLP